MSCPFAEMVPSGVSFVVQKCFGQAPSLKYISSSSIFLRDCLVGHHFLHKASVRIIELIFMQGVSDHDAILQRHTDAPSRGMFNVGWCWDWRGGKLQCLAHDWEWKGGWSFYSCRRWQVLNWPFFVNVWSWSGYLSQWNSCQLFAAMCRIRCEHLHAVLSPDQIYGNYHGNRIAKHVLETGNFWWEAGSKIAQLQACHISRSEAVDRAVLYHNHNIWRRHLV